MVQAPPLGGGCSIVSRIVFSLIAKPVRPFRYSAPATSSQSIRTTAAFVSRTNGSSTANFVYFFPLALPLRNGAADTHNGSMPVLQGCASHGIGVLWKRWASFTSQRYDIELWASGLLQGSGLREVHPFHAESLGCLRENVRFCVDFRESPLFFRRRTWRPCT